MGQDRAFGIARGAGGVHDEKRIGKPDTRSGRRLGSRGAFHVVGKIRIGSAVGLAQTVKALYGGARVAEALRLGRKIGRINEDFRRAVAEDIDELRNGQAGVERHHDDAGFGAGKKYFQKLAGIGHQERQAHAFGKAQVRQGLSGFVDPPVKLKIVVGFVFVRQKRLIRSNDRPLADPFANIQNRSSLTFITTENQVRVGSAEGDAGQNRMFHVGFPLFPPYQGKAGYRLCQADRRGKTSSFHR